MESIFSAAETTKGKKVCAKMYPESINDSPMALDMRGCDWLTLQMALHVSVWCFRANGLNLFRGRAAALFGRGTRHLGNHLSTWPFFLNWLCSGNCLPPLWTLGEKITYNLVNSSWRLNKSESVKFLFFVSKNKGRHKQEDSGTGTGEWIKRMR